MSKTYQPRQLAEALAILADRDLGAVPMAGCTDLFASLHAGATPPAAVVDLTRIQELGDIALHPGGLDIGALATFTAIRTSALAQRGAPLLVEAAATIGARQIQNRATLGGNIANASPAGDSLPVLLALEAELVLVSAAGERRMPYRGFHQGYRRTALLPGEIILRARIPRPTEHALFRFRKVGTRAAQAISKASLAFVAELEGGRLRQVRFAAGSVAPVPLRLTKTEQACLGLVPSREAAEEMARLAAAEVTPIDDVRSSADYRRFVIGQLVRRMILGVQAGERASVGKQASA